jgi:hypothetical protein
VAEVPKQEVAACWRLEEHLPPPADMPGDGGVESTAMLPYTVRELAAHTERTHTLNPRTVQIGRFRTPAMAAEGGRKRAHCVSLEGLYQPS